MRENTYMGDQEGNEVTDVCMYMYVYIYHIYEGIHIYIYNYNAQVTLSN